MNEEHEGFSGTLCESVLCLRDRHRRALRICENYIARLPPYEQATHEQRRKVDRLGAEFDAASLGLLMLTAAAVEGLVNYYLAMKLPSTKFDDVEYSKTTRKWTTEVAKIVAGYVLPTALSTNVSNLFDVRNNLMHGKTRIVRNGQLIHPGSIHPVRNEDLETWAELPWLLTRNLSQYDDEAGFYFDQHMPPWRP